MTASFPISFIPNENSQLKTVDFSNLDFGKYMSDHMLVATWSGGKWSNATIKPYGNLELAPTTLALHYAQSVFEGMKAYRMSNGDISIFRMDRHLKRLNISLERMCMPEMDAQLFHDGIRLLIEKDQQWVPDGSAGASLYIRPLVFASEARYGVKIADEYMLVVMTGPVAPFYSKPLKVKVEDKYIRAAKGGTGAAKCAGNYGGSFYATRIARQEGYDQVLWSDLSDDLYIEESGTMNVFFHIGDALITPPLSDSILEGITRDTVITLAREMGITVEERRISALDLQKAHALGQLHEAFGAGTAAVTVPISTIGIHNTRIELPAYTESSLYLKIQNAITDIRAGRVADTHHWNTILHCTK